MITKKLQKILHSHTWVEEEAPISFLLLDYYKDCYLFTKASHRKHLFTIALYYLHNDYGYEWSPADERKKVFFWMLDHLKRDPAFFVKKDKRFVNIVRRTSTLFGDVLSQDLSVISNMQLLMYCKQVGNIAIEQYGYSIITEAADVLAEEDFVSKLPFVPLKDIPRVVRILGLPAKTTYRDSFIYKLNSLALALLHLRKKNYRIFPTLHRLQHDQPGMYRDLKRFTRSYEWIDNSFKITKRLTDQEMYEKVVKKAKDATSEELKAENKSILKKVRQIKNEQQRMAGTFRVTKEGKQFLYLISYLTYLQDRRKELVLRFGTVIGAIMQEISRRTRVPQLELSYYYKNDIATLLTRAKRISKAELRKRKKQVSVSYIRNNTRHTEFFYGKEADEFLHFFQTKKRELHGSTVRGFVASMGSFGQKVRGKAKIIFDPDHGTIKPGEILITGMTRPEFMPLMKKARAVITNEGGITTHAAIVSRELGVPCIIGTKVSTSVFKNGDIIELDMKEGTIRVV